MAAHTVPYAATATVAFPADLEEKLKIAQSIRGFRFIHILAPCPPGWGTESADTIEVSRLAVATGFFPLYEVRNGNEWRLTVPADMKSVSLSEYLGKQRRFKEMDDRRLKELQHEINRDYERLLDKVAKFSAEIQQ